MNAGRPHFQHPHTFFNERFFSIRMMVESKANTRPIELHHDLVAEEALGGHSKDLGKRYFTSARFIGTVVVSASVIVRSVVSDVPRQQLSHRSLDIWDGCSRLTR
jgi:hypothetical protein